MIYISNMGLQRITKTSVGVDNGTSNMKLGDGGWNFKISQEITNYVIFDLNRIVTTKYICPQLIKMTLTIAGNRIEQSENYIWNLAPL